MCPRWSGPTQRHTETQRAPYPRAVRGTLPRGTATLPIRGTATHVGWDAVASVWPVLGPLADFHGGSLVYRASFVRCARKGNVPFSPVAAGIRGVLGAGRWPVRRVCQPLAGKQTGCRWQSLQTGAHRGCRESTRRGASALRRELSGPYLYSSSSRASIYARASDFRRRPRPAWTADA